MTVSDSMPPGAQPGPSAQAQDGNAAGGLAAEPAATPAARGKASNIWIVTWGTRGDHEPAAALALGLRASGHRVRVFGMSRMESLFAEQGLDYNGLDIPVLAHPANKKAKEQLTALAEAEGFEGPSKDEDYLFDTVLQWQEFLHRSQAKLHADGKEGLEVLTEVILSISALQKFFVTGQGLEKLRETRKEHLEFLARQAGKAPEKYSANARKQRAGFHDFMRRAARGLAWTPLDLMHTFMWAFGESLSSVVPNAGDDHKQNRNAVQEKVTALYAWRDAAAEGPDDCLYEQWGRWCARLPPLESVSSSNFKEFVPLSIQNMILWFEFFAPQERPALVITHMSMVSAGAVLQANHGVATLLWSSQAPSTTLKEWLGRYGFHAGSEDGWKGVPRPLRDSGPLRYLDTMRSACQLISVSPLLLESLSPDQQHFKACATGNWVLDGHSAKPEHDSNAAFGDQLDMDKLEAFLSTDGGPPVYIGFGSMTHPKGATAIAALAARCLQKCGRRVVLLVGWSGLQQGLLIDAIAQEYEGDPDEAARAERRILLLSRTSHEYLFPRCACTVHHGGAGTIHAALRAGVPTIVSPLAVDQFGNADWAVSLGCGVRVPPLGEVEPDALADAVTRVLGDESMKAKAKEVAAAMREERGVATAVDFVEKCLREPAAAPAKRSSPWVKGRYEFIRCDGGSLDLAPFVVDGEWFASTDKQPMGQIWHGTFVVKENGDGIDPGAYSVQAVWFVKGVVAYGKVSEDGQVLTWHDGSSHKCVASPVEPPQALSQGETLRRWTRLANFLSVALLGTWWPRLSRFLGLTWLGWQQGANGQWRKVRWENGMYQVYVQGEKIDHMISKVRGNNFCTPDGHTIGRAERGTFTVEENDDGIKPGKYTIKATWPIFKITRYGDVSEDGKAFCWDDGSMMKWYAPAP